MRTVLYYHGAMNMAPKGTPRDLVKESDYARGRGENPLTARNRRLRGFGPPYYKMPGKKSPVYVSQEEADAYYASFRHVPVHTARLMPETQPLPRKSRKKRRSPKPREEIERADATA